MIFYSTDPWALIVAFIALKSVNYAFSCPVRESLYIPTVKEIKFKSKTPLKSFAVNTAGIRKAQYVAEQVCNSPVPIQTVGGMKKI